MACLLYVTGRTGIPGLTVVSVQWINAILGNPEKECEKFRESFSGMQLNAQQDAIEEIITKVKHFLVREALILGRSSDLRILVEAWSHWKFNRWRLGRRVEANLDTTFRKFKTIYFTGRLFVSAYLSFQQRIFNKGFRRKTNFTSRITAHFWRSFAQRTRAPLAGLQGYCPPWVQSWITTTKPSTFHQGIPGPGFHDSDSKGDHQL